MLGHEYGHVYHQHRFDESDVTIDSKKMKTFSLAQEKEIVADIYAQEIILDVARDEYHSYPIDAMVYKDGAKIFLALEGLLKRARDAVGVTFEQESRYPATEQRLQFLQRVNEDALKSAPHLFQIDLGDAYVVAADVIWQRLRDRWPLVYQGIERLNKESDGKSE